jgi:hypothetical protein
VLLLLLLCLPVTSWLATPLRSQQCHHVPWLHLQVSAASVIDVTRLGRHACMVM